MNEQPRRRWFQFRLSTYFALIGIAAWAMATRPFVVTLMGDDPRGPLPLIGFLGDVESRVLNPSLYLPALALALFMIWKSRARRRAIQQGAKLSTSQEQSSQIPISPTDA